MKEIKLDKWELQLIRAIKQEENYLTKSREIWAERCVIDFREVGLEYINRALCDLALKMNLIDAQFILDLDPVNNWRFFPATNWNEILFSRLASLFRLLDIKDVPGYADYFNLTK